MYEELDDRMDDICGILIMVKAVYDATGYKIECPLDGDYFYDVYMEAMESATNELEYGTVMDYDNVNKYSFPQMDEYYELCKKYGRVNRISFKDNPYVKKASEIVATEMDGIYSYCLGWKLFTPKKKAKKRYNCLWVITDPEFNQHVSLVRVLCNIHTFYKEGAEEIKKALEPAKPQLKLLPIKKEIKKAA